MTVLVPPPQHHSLVFAQNLGDREQGRMRVTSLWSDFMQQTFIVYLLGAWPDPGKFSWTCSLSAEARKAGRAAGEAVGGLTPSTRSFHRRKGDEAGVSC